MYSNCHLFTPIITLNNDQQQQHLQVPGTHKNTSTLAAITDNDDIDDRDLHEPCEELIALGIVETVLPCINTLRLAKYLEEEDTQQSSLKRNRDIDDIRPINPTARTLEELNTSIDKLDEDDGHLIQSMIKRRKMIQRAEDRVLKASHKLTIVKESFVKQQQQHKEKDEHVKNKLLVNKEFDFNINMKLKLRIETPVRKRLVEESEISPEQPITSIDPSRESSRSIAPSPNSFF